ncbi:hypothetical protein BJ741DRAFT_654937 [Chytriomyces cf. hyalinus JEL632]|nr:hypothetical protein BJ741DRAFT_654937 [Chytriomyces cf. hyalinus JEL632]
MVERETQINSDNGRESFNSEMEKSKFKTRKCAIPILAIVFLQTFVVASVVLIIPLIISFSAMNTSNDLSTSTGRNVANRLAVKIQRVEGSLALESIGGAIKIIHENTLDMYKVISAYNNQSNLDSLLFSLANEVKFTGNELCMYYGTQQDAFIQIQLTGHDAIWIKTPLGYNDPYCSICQTYQQNFTKADREWMVKRNGSAAYGDWDDKTFTYSNFRYDNQSYYPTRRPWYKQAATLDADNVKVQFTPPYIYAGGTVSKIAGITANIPFFNANGHLQGVFGTDISFTEMHNSLKSFLQTPNAFMYVITRDGLLIGTSSDESIVDATGLLISANQSATPSTRITAQLFWNLLPENNKDFTLLHGEQKEHEGMYFQLRALQFAPYFVIVNGAPKSDYTGDIDAVLQSLDDNLQSNVRKIIGVSVGVFVAMVFISCVLTYFSITSIMIDATSFDFAAYKTMEKQFCSHITELATMEKVFYRMIGKFAHSIRTNQALKSAPGNESHIGSTAAPNRSQRKPL